MTDTEVTKTVDMVAYDADQNYGSLREWGEELTGVDLTTVNEAKDESIEVTLNVGRTEKNLTIRGFHFADEDPDEMVEGLEADLVNAEHVVETKQEYNNSVRHAGWDFLEGVAECIGNEFIAGGVGLSVNQMRHNRTKWTNDPNSDDPVHSLALLKRGLEERRVLAKESDRQSDDLYETMAEVPSFKFQVKMKSTSRDVIEDMTDEVVPRLHKRLANVEEVGKVRYMSCEVQETQKGECYNI